MQSRLIRPETGRPSSGGDVGHTIVRAFGNRGRPATGADEPVNERGPGSCDLVLCENSAEEGFRTSSSDGTRKIKSPRLEPGRPLRQDSAMDPLPPRLAFFLLLFSGWVN